MVHPRPRDLLTTLVARANTAKKIRSRAAKTKVIMGMCLGRQCVRVILNRPTPIAMKNVYMSVFLKPSWSNILVIEGFYKYLFL